MPTKVLVFESDPSFAGELRTELSRLGLAAQVVTPIIVGERLAAILSLHQLGTPRSWTDAEVAACTVTADRVAQLL